MDNDSEDVYGRASTSRQTLESGSFQSRPRRSLAAVTYADMPPDALFDQPLDSPPKRAARPKAGSDGPSYPTPSSHPSMALDQAVPSSSTLEELDDMASRPRRTPKKRKRLIEEDEGDQHAHARPREPDRPFGGLLSEAAAALGDRIPTAADRQLFANARSKAEIKLAVQPSAYLDDDDDTYPSITGPPPSAIHPALKALRSEPPLGSPLPYASTSAAPAEAGHSLRTRPPPMLTSRQDVTFDPDASFGPGTPGTPGTALLPEGAYSNIKRIQFGDFSIGIWFQAPYPPEFSRLPDATIHLCEFCLKYMMTAFQASRHRKKCKMRYPPGDMIYKDGQLAIWEVDGRKHKIYCQNLCLLSKMFLDHKTLYYDVDPFLFYVMTEAVPEQGHQFVGYFSKEKLRPTNNVSCIMTLPIRAQRGWGQFLIDFSYLLSKKEGRAGTPERPLSDLGLVTYRSYWTYHIFKYLLSLPSDYHPSFEEISQATSITVDDIFYILRSNSLVSMPPKPLLVTADAAHAVDNFNRAQPTNRANWSRRFGLPSQSDPILHVDEAQFAVPLEYEIVLDRKLFQEVVNKADARNYVKVNPELLRWTPWAPADLPLPGTDAHIQVAAHLKTKDAAAQQAKHRQPQPGQPAQDVIRDPRHPNEMLVLNTSGVQVTSADMRAAAPGPPMRIVADPRNGRAPKPSSSPDPLRLGPVLKRKSKASVASPTVALPAKARRQGPINGLPVPAPRKVLVKETADHVEESDYGSARSSTEPPTRNSPNGGEPYIPSSDDQEEPTVRRSPRKLDSTSSSPRKATASAGIRKQATPLVFDSEESADAEGSEDDGEGDFEQTGF